VVCRPNFFHIPDSEGSVLIAPSTHETSILRLLEEGVPYAVRKNVGVALLTRREEGAVAALCEL
jgi:hypothetical protein